MSAPEAFAAAFQRLATTAAIAVVVVATPAGARAGEQIPTWCAEEFETLPGEVCFQPPAADAAKPRTLILFLHSLVGKDTRWQWEQQRTIARAAARRGMGVLMPRGRLGLGPGRAPDVWAWPTAQRTEQAVEAELVAEWDRARGVAEEKVGRFERLLVFGFSSGAYYAASLALRARLDADGYALIAGGSGSRWKARSASSIDDRAPVFIGYGTKDPARRDPRAFARLLESLKWPHRLDAAPVGHTVTNAQLTRAFDYLSAPGATKPSKSARGSKPRR